MTVPKTYRKSRENIIASFSFTDIAEGTGTIIYNGTRVTDDSGEDWALITQSLEGSGSPAQTLRLINHQEEVDFNLSPFNLPKILTGTAYVSAVQSAVNTDTSSFTVQFKKVTGGEESNISSLVASSDFVGTGTEDITWLIPVPLTKTHFKKGDNLRITIENTSTETGGDKPIYVLPTSKPLKFFVPFDLNL